MPVRRVKTESGADKLRARVEPETTASASRSPGRPGRAASKSPARLVKGGPTRNSQRGNFDYLRGTVPNPDVPMEMEMEAADDSHSPPKQRKVDGAPIAGGSSATRKINFNPPSAPAAEDVPMCISPEDDITERIDRMIVSQLGGRRKRKKEKAQTGSETDSHDEDDNTGPSGSLASKAKRHMGEFDLRVLNEVMDAIDNDVANQAVPRDFFQEWMTLLKYGQFNILLTGVGSKIRLIQAFMETVCDNEDTYGFEVNGFSHGITVKTILTSIQQEFNLKTKQPRSASGGGHDFAVALGEALSSAPYNLILTIHSLDGPNLRFSDSTQQALLAAFVAAAKGHVNVVASIDHENATQIWNPDVAEAFAWINYPINMMNSYKREVLASQSILLERQNAADAHTNASLDVFWQALPVSAQRELALLTRMCVASPDRTIETNVLFDGARGELYTTQRQSFEAHLKEFRDHNLISMTQDTIKLIIDHNLLLNFMQTKEMDEA